MVMIYLKKKINSDIEIKIEVYDDEFYCICPECGKEVSDRAAACIHCGCPLEQKNI